MRDGVFCSLDGVGWVVLDRDAHRPGPAESGIQHGAPRVGDVEELPAGKVPQRPEASIRKDGGRKGRVTPQHETLGPGALEHPRGMTLHGMHQLVGLVVAPPREALLAPATRSRPGLDVPGSHLVGRSVSPSARATA